MLSSLKVTEINFDGVKAVGIPVETTMSAAPTNCPKVWENFIPIAEKELLYSEEHTCIMYGISFMKNINEFTYWASAQIAPDQAVPSSLKEVEIPAGTYIRVEVSNTEKIAEAYEFVFVQWLPQQNILSFDPSRPTFELYDKRYLVNGAFDLYVPVAKDV